MLAKLTALYDRYKLLFLFGTAAVLAFGFEFKTPRTALQEIRATAAEDRLRVNRRIDSLAHKQDSLRIDHADLQRYLRALAVAQCIDRPRRDWLLLGLPCDDLTRGPSGLP